jgi:hypothetical protein
MKSQIEQLLREAINMASEHDSHTSYVLNKVFVCLSDNAITEAVCCMEFVAAKALSWNFTGGKADEFQALCEKIQNSLEQLNRTPE